MIITTIIRTVTQTLLSTKTDRMLTKGIDQLRDVRTVQLLKMMLRKQLIRVMEKQHYLLYLDQKVAAKLMLQFCIIGVQKEVIL